MDDLLEVIELLEYVELLESLFSDRIICCVCAFQDFHLIITIVWLRLMYCHKSFSQPTLWQLHLELVLIDALTIALSSQDVPDALYQIVMRQKVEFAVTSIP